VHSFRKPRGDVEDDVPEPIAAKKRAMMKKATWDEFFHKHGEKGGKPYEFREHYHDNAIVTHPKFGRGFVSEVLSDSKVEITFKDSRRVLVHNRKDMPGLPLAAEGDGLPSSAKVVPPKAASPTKAKGAGAHPHAKEPAPAPAKAPPPPPAAKAVAKVTPAPKANISPAAAVKNRKAVAKAVRPAKPAAAAARTAKPARAISDSSVKRASKLSGKSAAKKSKK
jgi:hypothetical protein